MNGGNALFCGHCGAQIPLDSIFCPMCGSRAGAPGSVTSSHLHPPRRTPVHPQPAQPEPQPHGRVAISARPRRIALGALFFGVGVLMAVWFLGGDGAMSDVAMVATSMSAAALALTGIGLVVSGALHRAGAPVRCRRCAQPVVAWKGAFGLHCPLGPHYAKVHWHIVAITAAFWLGAVVAALVLAFWLV